MYQPSQLHAFLERLQVSPRAALSQNFLIDGNIITRIVTSAGCLSGDLVLEIGPGPGALTECLLKMGMQVIAVEKDHVFAEELPRLDTKGGQLTVLSADAMQVPFQELLQKRLSDEKKAYVVANLPYHLTTPLLMRLLPLYREVHSLTLMVQKEMAERLVASVRTARYGWLSPYASFFGKTKILFPVAKQLFFPKPEVDSVVIQVCLQEPPFEELKAKRFLAFLLSAFSQPRKMVRSRWAPECPKEEVESALSQIGCAVQARPEEIGYEQWLKFFALLDPLKIDFEKGVPFRKEGGGL